MSERHGVTVLEPLPAKAAAALGQALYSNAALMTVVARTTVALLGFNDPTDDVALAALPRSDRSLLSLFEAAYIQRLRPEDDEKKKLHSLVTEMQSAAETRNDFVHPWWWEKTSPPQAAAVKRSRDGTVRFVPVADVDQLEAFVGATVALWERLQDFRVTVTARLHAQERWG